MPKRTHHIRNTTTLRCRTQEGAALLVAMLLILMTTATATFAIRSTTTEIGSAGAERQVIQTQNFAESLLNATLAYVDMIGPDVLLRMMDGSTRPNLTAFGPPLPDNKTGYLFLRDNFPLNDLIGFDVVNPGSAHTPTFAIEVSDHFTLTQPTPGDRADGRGTLKYLRATVTARARTQVLGLNPSDEARNQWIVEGSIIGGTGTQESTITTDARGRQEGAVDARAYVVFGPFQR